MNRLRLNRFVGYIKCREEFPFDVDDVQEDLDAVLAFYGIFETLSDEERNVLKEELSHLALAEEEKEVVQLVAEHERWPSSPTGTLASHSHTTRLRI